MMQEVGVGLKSWSQMPVACHGWTQIFCVGALDMALACVTLSKNVTTFFYMYRLRIAAVEAAMINK